MSSERKARPYGLDPAFERVIAAMLCCRPKFYGVIGRELDPSRLEVPTAALIARVVQEIGKERGRGPQDPVLATQRLHRWVQDGLATREEVHAVVDLLDEHLDKLPPEQAVIDELAPILKRVLHEETVRTAMESYAKKGDLEEVADVINRARQVGVQDHSTGSKFGLASLKDIARMRQADRLPTGILELDAGLGGGLPRGKAGMIVGGAKMGKSMYLTNQIATGISQGLFVAEATLELNEEDQQTRLIANLTSIPIDAIVEGQDEPVIEAALAPLLPTLGTYRVKFFPAKVTSMPDIIEWVAEIEREEGRKIDLLVIDYLDKLGSSNRKHSGEYEIQGQAAEDFRLFCHGKGIWGWTASQPKRRDAKERQKRIEIDDIADSMGKARVMDLILTAHRPTEDEIEFFVAGNRHGKDKFSVGPFPHNLACAQIINVGPGSGPSLL